MPVDRRPPGAQRLAESEALAERLERATDGVSAPASGQARAATFAILAGPDARAGDLIRGLSDAIGSVGRTLLLTSADAALSGAGVHGDVSDDPDEPSEQSVTQMPLHHWLDEREAAHDFVIYVADPTRTSWTDQCLRQADHVVIVADAGADPGPVDVERRLADRWSDISRPRQTLLLLHPETTDRPRGTARWLDRRSVDQHLHLRRGRDDDLARAARFLTGRAISLVLGGGGARGYAHIGVVRALEEAGVPIDMVGGTSMGALIGAGVARQWSAEEIERTFSASTRRLFDATLPLVSLLSGRRIWRAIDGGYRDVEVEDLWLPFYCVSTNITRAETVIHRTGPLSLVIRASASLPGILPPVYWQGDLLVDGGLLDTVPVGVMRRLNGGGRVIAVDVAPPGDVAAGRSFATHPSGWRVLRDRLGRMPRRSRIPGILELLSRTVAVPSLFLHRHLGPDSPADLLLTPPVDRWSTLDFKRVHTISQAGYESAVGPVAEWWATESSRASVPRSST